MQSLRKCQVQSIPADELTKRWHLEVAGLEASQGNWGQECRVGQWAHVGTIVWGLVEAIAVGFHRVLPCQWLAGTITCWSQQLHGEVLHSTICATSTEASVEEVQILWHGEPVPNMPIREIFTYVPGTWSREYLPLLSTNREQKTIVGTQRNGYTLENTNVAEEMKGDCKSHWLYWL